MTKRDLLKSLEPHDQDLDHNVFIAERKTEFKYGLLNSVSKKEIGFQEDPDDEILAYDEVIILDEE